MTAIPSARAAAAIFLSSVSRRGGKIVCRSIAPCARRAQDFAHVRRVKARALRHPTSSSKRPHGKINKNIIRRLLHDMTTRLGSVRNRALRITRADIIRFAASFIAGLALNASVAETAAAQSRLDTTRMSCASARALVLRQGAIVLGSGPSIFDRYVASRAYCMSTEQIEAAFDVFHHVRH